MSRKDTVSQQESSGISSKTALLLLITMVVVGTLFRLHLLGARSLYVDEAASVSFARLPWLDLGRALWEFEANQAFYYVLLHGWIRLGDSEAAVRGLSVLFGVVTIPALYLLGRRLFGRTAGLVSAALLTVHVFHIRYSQEARSYTLLLLLLVLSTYFFLCSVESPGQKKYWFAYVLASALAAYSHAFAYLVLTAQWLSLGFTRVRRIGLTRTCWVLAGVVLLTLPMTLFVLLKDQGQISFIPRPTIRSVMDFSHLMTGNAGKPLFLLYAVSCLLALGWWFRPSGEPESSSDEPWRVRLIAVWLVFPIALTLVVSLVMPLFWDRYLVICLPAIVLLAGRGATKLDRLSPRLLRSFSPVLILMIGFSLWGLNQYYKNFAAGQPWQDEWRVVTRYILAGQQPGDALFFYRGSGSRAFTYYADREFRKHPISSPAIVFPDLRNAENSNLDPGKEQTELATRGRKRVWLVLYHYEELQRREAAAAAIQTVLKENFRLAEQRVFPGVAGNIRVSLYIRP